MVVADTHVLIYDALTPERLSKKAKRAVEQASEEGILVCCDISLWEIAMLISKGRIAVLSEPVAFIDDIVQARRINVLSISPEVAGLAQSQQFLHGDPADRLIASTAMVNGAPLITADEHLRSIASLQAIW